jgi:hypothetical protein
MVGPKLDRLRVGDIPKFGSNSEQGARFGYHK